MLFQRNDWTLFRSLDTLGQRAGVPRNRLGAIVAKELADNALDAGSDVVQVGQTDEYSCWVEDDGDGIPGTDEEIAELFSISRPLTSSKLLRLPTRGALGNGLRVVVGVVLATGGELLVTTKGRRLKLLPAFNSGRTSVLSSVPCDQSGTRIEVRLGRFAGEIRIDLSLARLAITMRGEKQYRGKTNARWYSLAAFRELVSAAPPDQPLGKLLKKFDLPAAKFKQYGMKPMLMGKLSDADVESTYRFLVASTKAPRPAALGAVGKAGPHDSYAKEQAVVACGGADLPCVVEVWAKQTEVYGDVHMLVNRTPVVSQVRHRVVRDANKSRGALHGCGLHHYVATGKHAFDATINVQIPYMPVTNDGKEPDLGPLAAIIIRAFERACRQARVPAARSAGGSKPASKRDAVAAALPAAIAKASGGGRYRYSLRQLYYAVRPVVGTDLDYGYFSSVVADIESDRGTDLPGIYRDARGQLYEPHTGRTIALGTLAVEQYERPKLHFNKVLYVEKGGLVQLLIDSRWPERNDCALVTSQGFASKACKDVLDLLGDTDEEIEFFCIHDADGPGTLIYEALQEASRARPARRVRIINLGLEPAEGRAMGLEVEEFERKRGRVPVADYVGDRDREWLQEHRVELNAMTSPQFLAWLDEKFSRHATVAQKVIPSESELREHALALAEGALRKQAVDRLLRENRDRIESELSDLMKAMKISVSEVEVLDALGRRPEDGWRDAVAYNVQTQLRDVESVAVGDAEGAKGHVAEHATGIGAGNSDAQPAGN
jgi:hypothetical protein